MLLSTIASGCSNHANTRIARFIIGYAACLIFILTQQLNATPSITLEELPGAILEEIEKSDLEIEKGNFEEAWRFSDQIIDSLAILADGTIPLDKRLERNLTKQKDILHDTLEELASEKKSPDYSHLRGSQTRNQIDTQKSLISAEAAKQNSKETDEKLTQVHQLITESIEFQNQALINIDQSNLAWASQDMKEAIDRLQSAIDLLKDQNENQQQKESGGNQSQKQSRKSQSENKNTNNQSSQGKDDSREGAKKPIGEDKKGEKLTPEEALKELSKMRKEATDKKEKRQKQMGVINVPGRIEVDKDW